MFGNSYLPLILFLGLLGLLFPIAIRLRHRQISAEKAFKMLFGLGAVVTIGFVVTACAYAITPSFFDHFEPSIALGAERVLEGEQAFSDPNGAAQYASLYGPNAYLFNAILVGVWPETIAGSKLAGAIAALGFCGFFLVVCARKNGIGIALLQVAAVLGPCLFFEQYGYWNRPEPLQLFGVVLALSALTSRSRFIQTISLGISVALLVNLKIHSILYVLPVIVELAMRRHWRVLWLAAGIACIGIAAPFFFVDLFSFPNYLASLRTATQHSLVVEMFAGNVCALAFYAFPAVVLLVLQKKTGASPAPILGELSTAYLSTLGIVGLLACVIGSKLGAGPQHLLPLLPHFAWIMGIGLRSALPTTPIRLVSVAATCAWATAMFVCAGMSQGKVWKNIQRDPGRIAIDDLHEIRAAFPQSTIQMGCGSSFRWFMYWYRPELRAHDPVDFLDITSWMDRAFAGHTFSEQTLNALRQGQSDMWLIPAACQPFAQASYYPPFGDFLGPEIRQAFAAGYRLAGRTRCYDIYLARRLSELPIKR